MRVSIIGINYTPEPTGIAPYTSSLAAGLAAAGHAVRVITGYPHYPQWRVQPGYTGFGRRERIDGVRVRRLRHYVPSSPGLVNRLVMELTFGLRAVLGNWGRPDALIVVSPALFASRIALLRARLTGVTSYVWVQDIYSLGVAETGAGGALAARALKTIERSAFRAGSRVVVIHDRFKRYLVDDLGIDSDKVAVIRNWAHIDEMNDNRSSAVRSEHGWGADEVVVLHAGNMGAKQDLENVVAASRLAAEKGSKVRFVLMGDGNQRARLQAMGDNANLDYLDPLPDADFRATLGSADILLVNERPGLTEMCVPSKLTSYFSTGLPVIAATDAVSITAEELALAHGGVRVDAGDPAALLSAAEALGADAKLRRTYGTAGKSFKREYLEADAAVARFHELISRSPAQLN